MLYEILANWSVRSLKSVPRSNGPQSPLLWTRGTAACETLRYLDSNGVDAEPLLAKAELSRGELAQDSNGVSVAFQCRFLELAAVATNEKRSNFWHDIRERRTRQTVLRSHVTKMRPS
jgi:hypothetical protein